MRCAKTKTKKNQEKKKSVMTFVEAAKPLDKPEFADVSPSHRGCETFKSARPGRNLSSQICRKRHGTPKAFAGKLEGLASEAGVFVYT